MSDPATAIVSAGADAEVNNMSIRVQADSSALAFLPDHVRNPILAFHAEIIGKPDWNWRRVKESIGYDNSTMSRVFRGKYTGSYPAVAAAIVAFFDRQAASAAPSEYVRTPIISTILNVCQYARANHTGALIIGPSRVGKTVASKEFESLKDPATRLPLAIRIEARPTGGVGSLRSAICSRMSGMTKLNPSAADSKIVRAWRRDCLFILDEAHRLTLSSSGSKCLDYVRWLTDEIGCGFALFSTVRFEDDLLESRYMFEQLIGRIEAPVRVGEEIGPEDWHPIVEHFIPVKALAQETLQALAKISISAGHLASIVHVMHLAQRDAANRKEPIADSHVRNAIQWRRQKFNQKFFFVPKGASK